MVRATLINAMNEVSRARSAEAAAWNEVNRYDNLLLMFLLLCCKPEI